MSLQEIIKPIEKELDFFQDYFTKAIKSKVPFVDLIVRYILKLKGKKIRPTLVLLTAKACGEINESTYRGAALVEILHTATLIHDDVVDNADTRRGLASINAVWKNKIAVLMGDYMFAKGFILSLDNHDFKFLKTISNAVRRMSEAEILQIARSKKLDIDEKTYLKIISDKTASLLSTCCEIGALSTTSDETIIKQMKEYGENVGMAFQIRDDLLDYIGKRSILGKPAGSDMREKKLTLPLIHALKKAPQQRAKKILQILKDATSQKERQTIINFVYEFGGIDYSTSKALEYSTQALTALDNLHHSTAKKALGSFVEFVLNRCK